MTQLQNILLKAPLYRK